MGLLAEASGSQHMLQLLHARCHAFFALIAVSAAVVGSQASTSTSKSPFQSATKTTQRTKPAGGADAGGDQRQRSIALVNEGLEVSWVRCWVGAGSWGVRVDAQRGVPSSRR